MAKRTSDIIRQRPDSPFWYENFTVNGRRFRGSTEETEKSQALAKAAQKKADAEAGKLADAPSAETMTIDQACGAYMTESANHRVSAHNILRALERATKHIGAKTLLSDLTTRKVSAWVASRRGMLATGKKTLLSPSTVNREIAYLRAALYHANEVHDIPLPPIKWDRLIQDEPDERETIINGTEESRLFDHLRVDYWPLVGFAILSGQRLGNCRHLRWKDVDFDRKLINFKVKSRKPGGRNHTIPMTDELAAILSVERGRHTEYVFTFENQVNRTFWHKGHNGKRVAIRHLKGQRFPFSTSGWRRPWLDALDKAGITDVRFHDLRHTAATRILAASGNIKVVQRLLGHADISTTSRYLRANVDDVREAMEKAQALTKVARDAKKAGTKPESL